MVHAGPAFNTILRPGRIGSFFFEVINLTGTDLNAVSTAIAFFSVNSRIHGYFKFHVQNVQ